MTIEKLRLMKTAYSPLYEAYVQIIKVRVDDNGVPIIDARVSCTDKVVIFREQELTEWCL